MNTIDIINDLLKITAVERRTFVKTVLFSSGCIILGPQYMYGKNSEKNTWKISMIYNNTGSSKQLKSAWGLAVWIEKADHAILFDTGGNASILLDNMLKSEIDLSKLTKIVISHNHLDHINGLKMILEKTNNRPEVYVVEKDFKMFSKDLPEAKIKSVLNAQELENNLWTTGQLEVYSGRNEINEHSLVLEQNYSTVLITGCSHSGITEMAEKTKKLFPDKKIELIIGGFHLMNKSDQEVEQISDDLKNLSVTNIAPSHCTGASAIEIFRKQWGKQFVDLNIGNVWSL